MRSPAPGCRSLIARATHVDLPKISQPCVPTTGACPKYTRVIASPVTPLLILISESSATSSASSAGGFCAP